MYSSVMMCFNKPTMNLIKSSDDGCYVLQVKDENNALGWHFEDLNEFMLQMNAMASMRDEIKKLLEEEQKGK